MDKNLLLEFDSYDKERYGEEYCEVKIHFTFTDSMTFKVGKRTAYVTFNPCLLDDLACYYNEINVDKELTIMIREAVENELAFTMIDDTRDLIIKL